MELNDNEFDATFRKKVFDADPEFEEEAWNKMEQKLKRRDRLVFFKKSALICALLLAGFGSYYLFEKNPSPKVDSVAIHKNNITPDRIANKKITVPAIIKRNNKRNNNKGSNNSESNELKTESVIPDLSGKQLLALNVLADELSIINPADKSGIPAVTANIYIPNPVLAGNGKMITVKRKRAVPLSFAISAGPEFNSASSALGGKTGFTAGLAVGVSITKKVNLQAGVKYSIKDYNANSYSYRLNNLGTQSLIANIDAACSVLEIPLQASYMVANNQNRSIDLNAGISSYMMLKENYIFRYIPQSGKQDHLLQKTNANQNFLSVVDLSATYYIKLKKDNLKLGLEPFMKIPLTGVGEGRVNLKSNGISLKLRYDLD